MMYKDLDKPLYDAEATTRFPNEVALRFQRPSPQGTTLTDLTAESGSSAAPTPLYKFAINLPSDPKEDEIFNEMIKNWIVNSSEELDAASSTSPTEESQKTSSQEPANHQVSFLGLDPGPIPPFPPLDAIPPFDLSSLDLSSLISFPLFPDDPLTSLGLTNVETTVGVTPSSIAQPLPHIPQSELPQAPMNPPAHKAQEDGALRRSNVLSSILVGSGIPSKCDSVRSVYMNVPKSTLGKRPKREKFEGSKPPLPLSGSGDSSAIKHHQFLSSYPFLPTSSASGTNTEGHTPFSLDSLPNVLTSAFPLPPSNTSLGNFPALSPPSDSPFSFSSYLPNGPFYNPQPAQLPGKGSLNNPPGYLDLGMSANKLGDPRKLSTPPAVSSTTNTSSLPPSITPPGVPLVNIENRAILKRTPSLVSTSTYDTKHSFVYEHRANPVRNHKDALLIMFGTHPLTYGERDTIERISGEQKRLVIERKVDSDAAGGTRRRR